MIEVGPFLTLLGALWVTFVPVSAQIKTLNETRDKILALDGKYSADHRFLMYRNDWVPLFIGAIVQQLVLIALLFWLPSLVPKEVPEGVLLVCHSLAVLAALRFVGFLWTFRLDYQLIARSVTTRSVVTKQDAA